MNFKKASAFLRIFFPFLVSFGLTFLLFGIFTVVKFNTYEVLILKKELYGLFFSFMIVYSVITFILVLLLYKRIRKISHYAGEVSQGKQASGPREDREGVFRHLITNIDAMSDRLKDQTESAGQEQKRIFAILESMVEGVLVIDAEHKIIMANSTLARAFDLTQEDVRGKYFWEVFRDSEINEMIKKSLSSQTQSKREHPALLTDSIFEIQVSPVFGGLKFLGVVAVFHNVTKLKALERAQNEFVANVSHELKTPLTSILGYIETLKNGAIDNVKDRSEFLNIIEDHSKKLHLLIEDLLVLSKAESDRQKLKKETVDLEPMLLRIFRFYEKPIKTKGLTAHVELVPKPFSVLADPGALEQALSNLIDNAIKYNSPSGSIDVRAVYEPGTVRIEIRDTGIGISPADQTKIFERFYRVEKSRSRELGGTGLGLSIVKNIAERHLGKIEVQSLTPKGTVFSLILPQ
ncbi:MAG: hypothetical protein AUJ72_03095 [Candidatus Omnitrophica bacterium CG1_02_46_14]|nr:MAG: hypothetical protein AUJ72_03095 [Candidatus Omnitrophica bacterium CG1_02_46_14]